MADNWDLRDRFNRHVGTLERLPLPVRLGRLVLERFPPLFYGPLVLLFAVAGRAASAAVAGAPPGLDWGLAVTAFAVFAAFLALRALDEIRDEAVDRAGRPGRPLPRGLVTRSEVRLLAGASSAGGGALAWSLSPTSVAMYAIAIAAIWLAGYGLLFRSWAGRGLVRYALAHSIISPLLMAFVWFSSDGPTSLTGLGALLLLTWGGSLGLEVARKTRMPAEERAFVETYSGAYGRKRATVLAFASLVTACVGALLLTVAAPVPGLAGLAPLLLGIVVAMMMRAGRRLGTAALRSAVSLVVFGLLLWPVVLASLAGAAPVTLQASSP